MSSAHAVVPPPQVRRGQEFVAATEAKLAVHGEYIRELEASLAAEQARVKQLLGADLVGLPAAGLQQLGRVHEEGLKRVRALQVRPLDGPGRSRAARR